MALNLNFFCKRSLPAFLLILLAGIVVYSNTFHVPFVLDDDLWIKGRAVVKNLDNFFLNSSGYDSSPTRIVGLFSLALNYHFGGLDVTGYHAVNLFIHLLSALLVFSLLRLTFLTPFFRMQAPILPSELRTPNSKPHSSNCLIPLFAALLFAVHPVQTQAVTYIIQRMTSLATLFYLLSVVLYVKARLNLERGGKQGRGKTSKKWQAWLLLAGSVLAAILAMKTKEISFTLPFAIVLYEVSFFRGSWGHRLLYMLPIMATLPIVPWSVLSARPLLPPDQALIHTSGGLFAEMGEKLRASTQLSRLEYFFTELRVILTYLRLLVFPVNQNLVYDYPEFRTFFTAPVIFSFLVLITFFLLAIWLFSISKIKDQKTKIGNSSPLFRLIAFGIFWFFLTLSVESSFIPIVDVIMEHRLYLSSVGAAIAFSTTFIFLIDRIFKARVGVTVLVGAVIISSLSVATYQRNSVWKSEVGLWEDVISKSPLKVMALNNLGHALNEAGKPRDAIPVLLRAISLAPYDLAFNNLAKSYLRVGKTQAAITMLRRVIQLNPDKDDAYNNLGAALIKENRYDEAIDLLEKNLDRLGKTPEVHFNLGVAYFRAGNSDKARRELGILYRLDQGLAAKLADFIH
jgi:hypothetical protein